MEGIYVDPSEKCSMWQNQHQEVDWVSIKINSISLITSNITKRQGFGDDDHVRGEWQFSHQLRSWGKRKIEWNLWWCYIPQKKNRKISSRETHFDIHSGPSHIQWTEFSPREYCSRRWSLRRRLEWVGTELTRDGRVFNTLQLPNPSMNFNQLIPMKWLKIPCTWLK